MKVSCSCVCFESEWGLKRVRKRAGTILIFIILLHNLVHKILFTLMIFYIFFASFCAQILVYIDHFYDLCRLV